MSKSGVPHFPPTLAVAQQRTQRLAERSVAIAGSRYAIEVCESQYQPVIYVTKAGEVVAWARIGVRAVGRITGNKTWANLNWTGRHELIFRMNNRHIGKVPW